ncbi:D-ser-dehydrat domain-containing protein [Favolaschia claudopus]|uniref:D-serine dehydratase n=1 Tax=Favolaschia claudopus TaxID=2862362 RepID=A0AAW0EBW5_9AGAR
MSSLTQTKTPYQFNNLSQKDALCKEFVGKPLEALRTPAMVIDRSLFKKNCVRMLQNAQDWGASLRSHLKTHKVMTVEGTRLQLVEGEHSTNAVVVSTLMEAWQVVEGGLVKEGIVKDILYGLPVAVNKVADLSDLWDHIAKDGATVRLMVDNPEQIHFIEEFEKARGSARKWSVFVKIDGGQRRAGMTSDSPRFVPFLKSLFESPAISVYGFYIHAGNAYASTSASQAASFLSSEVHAVNDAAAIALPLLAASSNAAAHNQPFVLSVGSTPTAHAATAESRAALSTLLHGKLELHAGNYPMLDLQQVHTSLVSSDRIAQRVIATVVSYYPERGANGGDEAMCDAGCIAMSKDTGPSGGYGDIIGKPWQLTRMSQEHGILTPTEAGAPKLQCGDMVEIVGQHACLIAAAYPWYYIVEDALPQELFDHIIAQLADDLDSLRTCALVSSSFLHTARGHLFSNIKVGPLDLEHSIEDLSEILTRFPYLTGRVRSLHLWDHIMRRYSWIEDSRSSAVAPRVADFSGMLVSLKRFVITIEAGFVHWANISKPLRKSIRLVVAIPTLTSVELNGLYGLPFTLFANCSALKSVKLKWVSFDERDNLDFAATLAACMNSPVTQLTHLDIELDTRVLQLLARWILHPESPLKITRLSSFVVSVDARSDYVVVQSLLAECKPTLERLQLKNTEGVLHLGELTKLRTLCMDTGASLEALLRWISNGIRLPSHAINLVVNLSSDSCDPDKLQVAAVDAALVKLRSIESVTLVLLPTKSQSESQVRERDYIDVTTAFAHRMPLLAGTGGLQVLRSP